ncbi:MAG: zinc ribbon domain-containing protein [Nitrosopumilus sp.]|nr:zinc ribbon domain-containing protein [Nitrosopumilus sp.]
MNKAHLMLTAFSLVLGTFMVLPSLHVAFAQYSVPEGSGGATIEEQLELAKEKISNAQQQGAYGSGTAMLGTNLDNTVIMIVIMTIIIGGVAGAFFAAGGKGRGKKKAIHVTHDGSSSDSGRFCTNCGVQASESQKFCGNCGTKI